MLLQCVIILPNNCNCFFRVILFLRLEKRSQIILICYYHRLHGYYKYLLTIEKLMT